MSTFYHPGEGEARKPSPKAVSTRADRVVSVETKRDRLDVVEVPVDTADLRNLNQPSDLPELPTDHGIA